MVDARARKAALEEDELTFISNKMEAGEDLEQLWRELELRTSCCWSSARCRR